ncbi:hypothetical protein MHOL44478_00215 [Mycobacterium holsaticum DSM 44478]|nr:hypothetical protein [Mycolicibacterium holsaticum DSM 44478 = JCM 12374]
MDMADPTVLTGPRVTLRPPTKDCLLFAEAVR